MLNARWSDVDFERPTVLTNHDNQNGYPRVRARARHVERIAAAAQETTGSTTEDAVKMASRRVMARIRLSDFRYHDYVTCRAPGIRPQGPNARRRNSRCR
jgi:hypothetical protein